jgi:hypothetical protein
MTDEVQIILVQHREHYPKHEALRLGRREEEPAPSEDPQRDALILDNLQQDAAKTGLEFKRRLDLGLVGLTGFSTWSEVITISGPYLAYAGGATAGIAVFVRNVLGSIAEWRKLRERRTISIDVKGKKIEIKDSATVDEVLHDIKTSLGLDDQPKT